MESERVMSDSGGNKSRQHLGIFNEIQKDPESIQTSGTNTLPSQEEIEGIVDTINKFRCGVIDDHQATGNTGMHNLISSVPGKEITRE